MRSEVYNELAIEARKVQMLEAMLVAAENQRRAFSRESVLADFVSAKLDDYLNALRLEVARQKRALGRLCRGEPVHDFVSGVHGLGDAVFLFLGIAPPLDGFGNPSKLWKYAGLAVVDGRAPKKAKGLFGGYHPFLQALAIARLAEPVIKVGGPYRALYDQRKAHTASSHPDMLEAGDGCPTCDLAHAKTKEKRAGTRQTRERAAPAVECCALGGPHWSPGHRHRDARRYVAKAILLDLWCVENGKEPRHASLSGSDALRRTAA